MDAAVAEAGPSAPSALEHGVGWGAACSVLMMLAVLALKLTLPPALWGANAGHAAFAAGPVAMFFVAIVWAPLFENLIAQLLPLEILRRLRIGHRASIVLVAILWGAGHYVNGGLAHGITALLGGACFAWIYLRYRAFGIGQAYWTSAIAHATSNALALIASNYVFG